jgi:hypothetical protein
MVDRSDHRCEVHPGVFDKVTSRKIGTISCWVNETWESREFVLGESHPNLTAQSVVDGGLIVVR